MADDTFLAIGADADLVERIPATAGGNANAGRVPKLDNAGRLTDDMMPASYGQGADAEALVLAEAVDAGDACTVQQGGANAGKVVKAVASAGSTRAATGHVDVAGQPGDTVQFRNSGKITVLSGLTPGATYYLSDTTPGKYTTTPPTGTGKLLQKLGVAASPTTLDWEPGLTVRRG